ncbi:formylglycine-generating enzyme family protein [bacterium]|nr:formylglycine-generating enzyme family protein [bacterium]
MKIILNLSLFLGSFFACAGTLELSISHPISGDLPVISINGESGVTYEIQSSTDLVNFESVDSMTLDGESGLWVIPNTSDYAFFRVVELDSPVEGFQIDTLPDIVFVSIPEGSFSMGDKDAKGPIADTYTTERVVNISGFEMSEAEITTQQYVTFLNAALADGLIEVVEQVVGPPGTFVFGTEQSSYQGHKLIDLSGSRVLKDHDGDTTIDPENPLNQCWVEYDLSTQAFSVKDPQSVDWDAYVYEEGESRADWEDLAEGNLPTMEEVAQWPVTFIKWYGAYAFADYYGVALPTEAQWEYAAQGGQGHVYPSDDGSMDASKANYNEDNAHPDRGHVVAVKSYPPNPFGLYDLAGNVWEWCADWFDPDFYSNSPDPDFDPFNDQLVLDDTEPLESPDYTGGPGQAYNADTKVKRGGSWNFHQASLESSARERDFTWRGNDHFGFRVVTQTAP